MSEYLETLVAGPGRFQVERAALVPLRPAALEDEALRQEIELLLDVMASVADCPVHLTAEQVDAALRIPHGVRRSQRIDHGPTGKISEPVLTAPEASWGSAVGRQPTGAGSGVMSDLFQPEPEHWGPRGDSCHRDVWATMLSRLAAVLVPPTRQAVERVLGDAFRAVVGVDLSRDPLPEASKKVYRLHVTEDEMSSGVVDVEEWKHRLIPILLSRAGRTTSGP